MCEIADWIVFGFMALAGILDLKTRQVPLLLLIKMGLSILLLRILVVHVSIGAMVGGIAIGIFFFGLSKITKEAVGYGDCILILLLGIYCGGFYLLQIVLFASIGSAVASLFYCAKRGWKRKQEIPFVPFLTVAYIGVMLL